MLPYGTGNDFARVTGWGGTPYKIFYKTLKSLIKEICLNSFEEYFNVWDVIVTYKDGGATLSVDSSTRRYSSSQLPFNRYMINYCGIG